MKAVQTVTAAVMRRAGLYFIAKRKAGGDLSGKWEFPGGKVRPGEGEKAGLARELREELAIEAHIGDFVAAARFEHAGKDCELKAYWAEWTGGDMELREHDEARWIAPADFEKYDIADSDRAIVRALLGIHAGGR